MSEPSAVEVIETVQREHSIERTGPGEVSCRGCRKRGWMPWSIYHRHVAEATDAALKAAGFLVATRDEIRAMTPEQQAELIGGVTLTPTAPDEDGYVRTRVIGPWLVRP